MALNLNTDLALITTTNPGTITLPLSTSIPGRVITFKDVLGTFGTNTLTLNTTGGDTFEDGGTTKVLRESYGYIQLVASSGKWYILNGNQVNTIQVSTLTALNISSFNISTASIGLSSLSFIDNRASTNSLNVVSTFLTYNNFIISGTKVGYSGKLNIFRFAPYAIPGLTMWLDGADSNTITFSSGNNISLWKDKSPYGYNGIAVGNPTYTGSNVNVTGSVNYFTTIYQSSPNIESLFFVFNYSAIGEIIGGAINSFTPCRQIYFQTATSINMAKRGITGLFPTPISGLVANTTTLLDTVYSYPSSSLVGYLNGSLGATALTTTISGFPFSAITNTTFAGGVGGFTGYYNEILIFNTALNNLQRQQIEGYLAWKWGLQTSLPASHPYKNAPPQ